MSICPSAIHGISIPKLLNEIVDKHVFEKDYAEITAYFQRYPVEYVRAIEAIKDIAESGIFDE